MNSASKQPYCVDWQCFLKSKTKFLRMNFVLQNAKKPDHVGCKHMKRNVRSNLVVRDWRLPSRIITQLETQTTVSSRFILKILAMKKKKEQEQR